MFSKKKIHHDQEINCLKTDTPKNQTFFISNQMIQDCNAKKESHFNTDEKNYSLVYSDYK